MIVTVWVLTVFFKYNSAGGAVVVDNIASAESCAQLAKVYEGRTAVNDVVCAPVKKLVVKGPKQ